MSHTGQRNVDEVLHPRPENLSDCWKHFFLPARQCQHTCNMTRTVCKLVMSYPFNWPSGSRSISHQPPLGYSRLADTCRIPFQLPYFSNQNTDWLNIDNVFHKCVCVWGGGGVQPQVSCKHVQKPQRMHS